jgi:Leucine-rich repeat (LRR) protein
MDQVTELAFKESEPIERYGQPPVLDYAQLFDPQLLRICQLKQLQRLSVIESGLVSLPEELGTLVHLEILNFSFNQLDRLPRSFSQLKLADLYLPHNKFTRFPQVLCEMTSLINLDMSFNELERIPNTKLELRILMLDYNKITRMPKWIIHCKLSSFLGNPCTVNRWRSQFNTLCDQDYICLEDLLYQLTMLQDRITQTLDLRGLVRLLT